MYLALAPAFATALAPALAIALAIALALAFACDPAKSHKSFTPEPPKLQRSGYV